MSCALCRQWPFGIPTDVHRGKTRADVAQMVERILGKDEVTSSILVIGSTFLKLPILNSASSDAKRPNIAGVWGVQPAQLYDD